MYENMKALKIRLETIPVSSFEMQMEVRFESEKSPQKHQLLVI